MNCDFYRRAIEGPAGACSPTEGLILEGLPDCEQPARCLFSSIQRQILSSKMSSSSMCHKRLTSRECPILQDIDGLIATILAHNGLMPTEELVTAITDSVDADDVKSCRVQLFGVARGLYHEMLSDGDLTQTVYFRLKSRRGVTARAACARDLVRLFQYISGLVTCFPMDTITAPCHPLLTRSQPDAHIAVGDKPDVTTDLRNLSQPLSELVHRCGDHDRAIVDMQCTLSNALNEINKLKHTNANSGSSLSPDTTTCSDKSSVLLVLDDDYPCPAQPPRDPGHHDGSPLEDSNNISVILSNTDNVSPSQSVPVRSADAPAPTGIQLLTPDCSFNQTNKSLSSLLQSTPRGSHSTQVNEGTDPSRAHDKSNNTCSLSHCELQSKVDQLILELRSISDNYAKLENRVHALEAQVNDDSHFRPIFDEVTSNRQCMDEIRHTVNELKEHVGCQKTVEPASDSTNGHTNPVKDIVTVPCSNRFAVLQDHTTDDVDVVHYEGAQSGMSSAVPAAAQGSQSPEPMADTRAKKARGQRRRRVKVSIVGSSLVRGLGHRVHDSDIDACCNTFPGGTIESIAPRLSKVTREDDDVILIAAGTNNIPRCDVPTIIRRAGEMIDDLHEMRPNARLLIPAIPRRYDDPDHRDIFRDKINKVNSFLEHKCKKNPNFHFLKHNFCFEDYKADGLHFKPIGVDKYASNIKAMINSMNIYGK